MQNILFLNCISYLLDSVFLILWGLYFFLILRLILIICVMMGNLKEWLRTTETSILAIKHVRIGTLLWNKIKINLLWLFIISVWRCITIAYLIRWLLSIAWVWTIELSVITKLRLIIRFTVSVFIFWGFFKGKLDWYWLRIVRLLTQFIIPFFVIKWWWIKFLVRFLFHTMLLKIIRNLRC